jgi:hypothetical protein
VARKVYKREEWGAKPARSTFGKVADPVSMVFIHTSVTAQLPKNATVRQEKDAMLTLQGIAFGRGFSDISYSFVIFPSGRIYEGRGWGKEQAATLGYNVVSYSICMGGNTDMYHETKAQRDSIVWLIERGQKQDRIKEKVDVRGHREVAPKACPGRHVTEEDIADIQKRVNK